MDAIHRRHVSRGNAEGEALNNGYTKPRNNIAPSAPRLRLLVGRRGLISIISVGVLLYMCFRSYHSYSYTARVRPFVESYVGTAEAFLSPSSRRETYPLSALNAEPLASIQAGALLLLPADTPLADTETVFCDILAFHSSDSGMQSGRPLARKHITVAFIENDKGYARDIDFEGMLVRAALNPKCSPAIKGELNIKRPLPSISSTHIHTRQLPRLFDDARPQTVISAMEISYTDESRALFDNEQEIVWIKMPLRDLAHSSWIFTLPEQSLLNWHKPAFKVMVITRDRVKSLERLRTSLDTAHYFGDKVTLQVNVEGSADEPTLTTVRQWTEGGANKKSWQHGDSHVLFRFREAGLITNILEAWWPSGNDEYAFFFEDDIEASPYYFAWAKWATLLYRYGPNSDSEDARHLYGISLIQQKTSELDKKTGRVLWNATSLLQTEARGEYDPYTPYLSQVPSSWGALFFPETWREFHKYIQIRHDLTYTTLEAKLINPSVVSDGWKTSWKRYLIELVFLRGYTMFYPNYPDFSSLSTNHVELGEHIDPVKQAALRQLQEVPLMTKDGLMNLPGRTLPRMDQLPVMDLWGRLVNPKDQVVDRGLEQRKALWNCTKAYTHRKSNYNASDVFSCEA